MSMELGTQISARPWYEINWNDSVSV